jgi:hypothetical protein
LCQGTTKWQRNSGWSPNTNLPELSQFEWKTIEILDFERIIKLGNVREVPSKTSKLQKDL